MAAQETVTAISCAAEPLLTWRDGDRSPATLFRLRQLSEELIHQLRSHIDTLTAEDYDLLMAGLVGLRREVSEAAQSVSAQPEIELGPRGQVRYAVDPHLFRALCAQGFTDRHIGEILGWHSRTVIKRRQQLGITKRGGEPMDEAALVELIRYLRRLGSGQEGERALMGALRAVNVHVTRDQLRAAIHTENPEGAAGRWRRRLHRRRYDVPYANGLWHIDGHHKLIRYKVVIHGGIDGQSHVVTFLNASTNNRAETMLNAFTKGVQEWGLPQRVRADHGGEMVGVQSFMNTARGPERGAFITGPSTSNQRIERLWVDLQCWSTDRFAVLFSELEQMALLDISNAVHVWCLHRAYLPAINKSLRHFQARWNLHPMSTRGLSALSPLQQWTKSILMASRQGLDISCNIERVVAQCAFEEPLQEDGTLHVPDVLAYLPPPLHTPEFQQQVSALGELPFPLPQDHGLSHYCRLLELSASTLHATA